MTYYLNRIFNDKLKLIITILFLFLPSFEVLVYLKTYGVHFNELSPNFCTFLSAKSVDNGHIIQGIILWFLPIYLLIINSEDVIEDKKTGNRNILITYFGKNKYFFQNLKKSFLISFFIMLLALIINFLFVNIAFNNESNLMNTYVNGNNFMNASLNHPTITNIAFILITALLSGIIGTVGTGISLAFHNRQIVYPVVFLIWLIPCMFKWSLLFSTQPFTEYTPYHMLPAFIFFLCESIIALIFSYFKGVKYAKI